jgi:hypothetical protein
MRNSLDNKMDTLQIDFFQQIYLKGVLKLLLNNTRSVTEVVSGYLLL